MEQLVQTRIPKLSLKKLKQVSKRAKVSMSALASTCIMEGLSYENEKKTVMKTVVNELNKEK